MRSSSATAKTITRLGQILAVAEERDLIPRNPVRRALIATLVYGGLRIGEATALRWRDTDLGQRPDLRR